MCYFSRDLLGWHIILSPANSVAIDAAGVIGRNHRIFSVAFVVQSHCAPREKHRGVVLGGVETNVSTESCLRGLPNDHIWVD